MPASAARLYKYKAAASSSPPPPAPPRSKDSKAFFMTPLMVISATGRRTWIAAEQLGLKELSLRASLPKPSPVTVREAADDEEEEEAFAEGSGLISKAVLEKIGHTIESKEEIVI